ncbi:MAG TPA: hypothetical protein VFQ45_16670, partial [Longimicrobium sp.]|nr:hypothetical protein [Longimicrobium sp.]
MSNVSDSDQTPPRPERTPESRAARPPRPRAAAGDDDLVGPRRGAAAPPADEELVGPRRRRGAAPAGDAAPRARRPSSGE